MTRARWILVFSVSFIALIGIWLVWTKPRHTDLSTYAPPAALLYIECNSPAAVTDAIAATEAWKQLGPSAGFSLGGRSRWTERFVAWTGIGPIESVLLARSQVAVVVTSLAATEENESLRIKPDGALIIDTHTSAFRTRNFFQDTLQRIADRTYVKPVFSRTFVNDLEFMEWASPDGSRQIVAAISGTVVVVGNNRKVVQECFNAASTRISLSSDPELKRLRTEAANSLALGYAPAQNSAMLLSMGLPMVLGRAPGDGDFQRLISMSATKLFGSLSWSTNVQQGVIEDRYLIALRPQAAAQLRSASFSAVQNSAPVASLPNVFQSATYYRFEQPLAAWQGLRTTVSSQVDAVSAVVFSTVLRSSLVSYGIEQPEQFLALVEGEILTARRDEERNILVARFTNLDLIRRLITGTMNLRRDTSSPVEVYRSDANEFAAAIAGQLIVVGHRAEVAEYAERGQQPPDSRRTFRSSGGDGQVITFSDDSERVRNFVSALLSFTRPASGSAAGIDQKISTLPYAVTESTFTSDGLLRVTRSPLGQFSTLLPLMVPDQSAISSPSPSP